MREELVKSVCSLRDGDMAQERVVLEQLRWLIAMFITKNKSRHGRMMSLRGLERDVKDSIIESAILCPCGSEQWVALDQKILRDIDTRIRDRIGVIVEFRKRAVCEVPDSIEAPVAIESDTRLESVMSVYSPQKDVDILYMRADGATFRSIAQGLGVSCTRISFRFRRCTARLRNKLST